MAQIIFRAFLLISVTISLINPTTALVTRPLVYLEQGVLEGVREPVEVQNIQILVNIFKGVPYAQPPVGDLRFQPAHPLHPGQSEQRTLAINYKPNCWSTNLLSHPSDYSEDCLYLNIWAPSDSDESLLPQSRKVYRPVLVYINGGLIKLSLHDDDNGIDGKMLAIKGNLIVVTVNYRQGPFGWLYADHPLIPGNAGLTDLATALRWIHENIKYFGGDPNRVIVDGLGSGSLYSTLLFLSGHANKTLNGLVVGSGQLNPLVLDNSQSSKQIFSEVVTHLGCGQSNEVTSAVISCLRSKPESAFVNLKLSDRGKQFGLEPYRPTLGTNFIPETSLSELYRSQKWPSDVSILVGLTSDQGTIWSQTHHDKLKSTIDYKGCSEYLKAESLNLLAEQHADQIDDIIKAYCKGYESASRFKMSQNLVKLFADWLVTCPTLYFADKMALFGRNPVYSYKFTYFNGTSLKQFLSKSHKSERAVGPQIGSDKIFEFGQPFVHSQIFNSNDQLQSDQLIGIYKEFAQRGKAKWSSYHVTSSGRIIPHQKEINVLKNNKGTIMNQDKFRCLVWDDLLFD